MYVILCKITQLFYIFSPENVRARNDLFYLQPERSCVPDSPVWFSTSDLNQHQIDKMLQRVLMVREVQEHMLADSNQPSIVNEASGDGNNLEQSVIHENAANFVPTSIAKDLDLPSNAFLDTDSNGMPLLWNFTKNYYYLLFITKIS